MQGRRIKDMFKRRSVSRLEPVSIKALLISSTNGNVLLTHSTPPRIATRPYTAQLLLAVLAIDSVLFQGANEG